MDSRVKQLISQGDYGWSNRKSLDSFWQEASENFYPERADFTTMRYLGQDFAANLTTSYPLIARRELANAVSTMLRPRGEEWFKISVQDEDSLGFASKQWLERATSTQRGYVLNKNSQFVRASKECDNDFVTFGQAVKMVEPNRNFDGLLYRTWHLRDCVWFENADGIADEIHRKWTPTARELSMIFRDKIHPKVKRMLEKEPMKKVQIRHIMIPTEHYQSNDGAKKKRQPFCSIFLDIENEHIMEDVGSWQFKYIIPRWQTVSGSQYAYSPAVVAALPDARLIQAMTFTLLEAGEKAVNPPMVGTQDALRSDVNTYAGGITWVDYAYDEKMGEALRPMTIDKSGLGYGIDIRDDTKMMIAEAFFLNKLSLPFTGKEMTAYESAQRVQDYIRNALPLFEPIEQEDNAATQEMTFDILLRAGAFGPQDDIPDELRGREIEFKFKSPLTENYGRKKGQKFLEAKALLASAAEMDASVRYMIDAKTALRDALEGVETPLKWLNTPEQVAALAEQDVQKQNAAQVIEQMQAGGMAAEQMGKAGIALKEAQAI